MKGHGLGWLEREDGRMPEGISMSNVPVGVLGRALNLFRRIFLGSGSSVEEHPVQDDSDVGPLGSEGAVAAEDPASISGNGEPRFSSPLWLLGRRDGEIGQHASDSVEVIESRAELDWIDRRSRARRAVLAKSEGLERASERVGALEREVAVLRLERRLHSDAPLLEPEGRRPWMAFSYLLVGVLAFFAELPLALNLIDQGLRLDVANLVSVSRYATWGLAFAMCIFGLVAKMTYDCVTRILRTHPGSEPDARIASVLRSSRYASAVLLGVSLFAGYVCARSVISIAHLRGLVEIETRLYKSAMPAQPPTTDGERAEALDVAGRARRISAERSDAGNDTFFWLTLSLPLFGSVALITASGDIRRLRQDRRAFAALCRAERVLEQRREEVARLKSEVAAAKERIKEEEQAGTSDAYLRTNLAVFRHGYSRGVLAPRDPSASLYDLYLNATKRRVFREIRFQAGKEQWT